MSPFGSLRSEAAGACPHLERHGCHLLREGSSHTLYFNPEQRQVTTIPRQREINDGLGRKICGDLGVPEP